LSSPRLQRCVQSNSFLNAARFLTKAQASIHNSEDVLQLQKQIMTLTSIFTRWCPVHDLPLQLRTRIEFFFVWVHFLLLRTSLPFIQLLSDLVAISSECDKLASRGTVRRSFTVTDDTGRLIIHEIDQLVQRFQVTRQFGNSHVFIFLGV
jgi:uncharacterized protein YerC